MLENIAVSKHKILERTLLRDLGRVNIICGRNDSGKSTLVEAICRPNGIAPGRDLSKTDAQLIFDQTSPYMGWSDSTPNRPENIALLGLIEQIATGRHLWFRDESEEFALTIQDSFWAKTSNKCFRKKQSRRGFSGTFTCRSHAIANSGKTPT
ncbi:MAG TPA: hypothetical protein VN851_16140 [Thermoanaerobaculia bacterium]|nr:hypothetical protein [Thermoanaerobaculia bacterium]